MTIRLLLADDHAMVRKGLQMFLSMQTDLQVIGEAANGQEAIDRTAELLPDMILMDLHMPVLDGIEVTKRLKQSHPDIKVIVLTSFSDEDHVLPAIRAGAKGYLLKDIEPDELVRAIRRVWQGQVELHPDAAGRLMSLLAASEASSKPESHDSASRLSDLTKRELEVLRLIASGMSNKEIGDSLNITEKTVKTHVSHVLDKLGLADRTQAAIFAVKHGLDQA
ncbi:response regulator [Paenibacillus xylaniclasticus]|uniref:response regulator n=1 Tax=Paenibacillus xylaniclasticus TaxID=588083 RepID=UPI000FDB2184|nr:MULTISPECIES: response regulator transcription factor [Paenibacillus]GFN31571.1 DNA-binding response regulator [Paenibacillus curdlanolyticus]